MSDQPPFDAASGPPVAETQQIPLADPAPGAPQAATGTPGGPGGSWKSWLAAGVVAAVVVGGAGFAISRKDSGATASVSAANTTAPAGATSTGSAQGQAGSGSGQGQGRYGRGFPGGRGTAGTITGIEGTTLTVQTAARQDRAATSVTVKTTGDTKVSEVVKGSSSDLAVGDTIRAQGETSGDIVTATQVTDMGASLGGQAGARGGFPGRTPPAGSASGAPSAGNRPDGAAGGAGGRGGFGAIGTIKAISGKSVTVEGFDGNTTTVVLTDDTTVQVTKQISLADLAKGDTVTVTGTTDNSTVTATSIRRGELLAGRPGAGFPDGAGPPDGSGSATPTTIS